MLVVLGLFGFFIFPQALLIVPRIPFLPVLFFGAVGMFFTGIIPIRPAVLTWADFSFSSPRSVPLFSGTFFPVAGLPDWAQTAALAFPLYHLVELTRFCCSGLVETSGP